MPEERGGIGMRTTTMTRAGVKVVFAGIWIPHKKVQQYLLYDIPQAHLQHPSCDPQAATGWVGQCVFQLQHCNCSHIIC